MNGSAGIPLAVLALTLVCPFPSHAAGGDDAAARISDRMLSALVEANGVPGMGAAVVRDGTTVWAGSAGYRDVEQGLRVERDTAFRLASVSKVVAATAAARLREEGALDVDAPVQSLLPWLKTEWAPLTSRQLAAHSSGMPHYQDADRDRGKVHYDSVRDAVGIFGKRVLLFSPGTSYSYSSWGYTLLSAVIEARGEMAFLDYLSRSVTSGLAIGPDATGTGANHSKAYRFEAGRAVPAVRHDFSYTWAGGGLSATPEAIAKFGARVMAGDIVSPSTVDWMFTPTRLTDGNTARERDFEVGFGWRVAKDADGARVAHHAGVTEGARSALVLWPDRKLDVSVLSNALWVSSIEQTAMMLAAPFQAKADRPSLPPRPCPLNTSTYEIEFDGHRRTGSASFVLDGGICIGSVLMASGPLRDWLNGFPQRDSDSLQLVGLDTQGGFSRAALVTPIGLHDLRVEPDGDGYTARFGVTRTVILRFR